MSFIRFSHIPEVKAGRVHVEAMTFEEIAIPAHQLISPIWNEFIDIDYQSQLSDWLGDRCTEWILLMDPLVAWKPDPNVNQYELCGGFRAFQLLRSIGKQRVDVVVLEGLSDEQVFRISLGQVLRPLMMWTPKGARSVVQFTKFLKNIRMNLPPRCRRIVPKPVEVKELLGQTRGQGRTAKYTPGILEITMAAIKAEIGVEKADGN